MHAALRNERVEHFSAGLSGLPAETRILRRVEPGFVLFVRLQLPAFFDGNSQPALIEYAGCPVLRNGGDHAVLTTGAFFPRRANRIIRRKPASCCSPQDPFTRAGSAPESPVSTVLSRNLAVPKAMSHTDKVVPKLQLRLPAARNA